jgi:hypothetical protein
MINVALARSAVEAMDASYETFKREVERFKSASLKGDEDTAQEARLLAVEAMQDYFDHSTMVFRAIKPKEE